VPTTANQILATRIAALRKTRSWSQEELADLCGLHRTYIGAIERGERNVTLATLDRIAKAFKLTASRMLDGSLDG
jgi:transcriptional regulator with XRE-family HTH domain